MVWLTHACSPTYRMSDDFGMLSNASGISLPLKFVNLIMEKRGDEEILFLKNNLKCVFLTEEEDLLRLHLASIWPEIFSTIQDVVVSTKFAFLNLNTLANRSQQYIWLRNKILISAFVNLKNLAIYVEDNCRSFAFINLEALSKLFQNIKHIHLNHSAGSFFGAVHFFGQLT